MVGLRTHPVGARKGNRGGRQIRLRAIVLREDYIALALQLSSSEGICLNLPKYECSRFLEPAADDPSQDVDIMNLIHFLFTFQITLASSPRPQRPSGTKVSIGTL